MRDIALTLIVLGILPLAVLRPWIGVLAWYWLGLMNPHRLTFGFAYTMPFAMMVGGALLLGFILAKDRQPIPWTRELVIIALLMLCFTFTTPFAWAPEEAWAQWEKVFKIIMMTFVAIKLIHGRERIRWLLLVIAFSIGFYGFKGGIFTVLTGGVHKVEGPAGTFIAGNTFMALALLMVLPLLVSLGREENRRWLKLLLFATAGLSIISIVFTYSRGALLGLGAVAPLLFMRSKKKFLVILLLLPIGYFGKDLLPDQLVNRAKTLETYEEDNSSMQRLRAWAVAWNIAKEHPLTGAGFEFEYYPDKERWFRYIDASWRVFGEKTHAAHSIYFQVLGQHGFPAFLLFLALLAASLATLNRIRREAGRIEGASWLASYASAMQTALVGYMVAGAFLSLAYFDLMYIYVALSAVMARELQMIKTASGIAKDPAWRRAAGGRMSPADSGTPATPPAKEAVPGRAYHYGGRTRAQRRAPGPTGDAA